MNTRSRKTTLSSAIRFIYLSLLVVLAGGWTPPLSAQTLPFHGSATSSSTLWWITQLGLGPAGEFQISNSSNANPAVLVTTNGSGPALRATAGSGLAGDFGGKVRMTGFQLSSSPAAGYVLTSDASGNGVWKKLPADVSYKAGAGLALSGTTFSIATGGVTSSLLANGAVTASKIAWPLAETFSSGSALLSLTNTGTGDGGDFFAGSGIGVLGISKTSNGVDGYSTSGTGVYGGSNGPYSAAGAFTNYSPAGADGAGGYGVLGQSNSDAAAGYFLNNASGNGVDGFCNGQYAAAGSFTNSSTAGADGAGGYGVLGQGYSNASAGLFFNYAYGNGVSGISSHGVGVYGRSSPGDGVVGISDSANGVYGYSSGNASGIYGESGSANTWAGYFQGGVNVTGQLIAANKNFKIDHPLDPTNKYLLHSCVESDQMSTIYNGHVILDASGSAWVDLPDWFQALNKAFEYHLTCIGGFAPVYIAQEIENNRFQIAGGKPGMKVSWQVTGIRQDAYAKAHPLEVEQDKPKEKKGKFLHPREYGQSDQMGEDYEMRQRHIMQRPSPAK